MTIATLDQGLESTFTPQNGIRIGLSTGNVVVTADDHRGRDTGLFKLVYPIVTESQKYGFFTEYNGQSRDEFTFTWQLDNSTHTVIYAGQPKATFLEQINAWRIIVLLAKVPLFFGIGQENGDAILQENGDKILIEAA